ncbi:MAG TPA: hypothetical protein DDX98_02220 [Bacteroidales bacterium]|nr:hypothetical protein [Bacteroidales bacterium]
MKKSIWRYMPLSVFEELIKTQQLRFSPIRDFNDPNDGHISDKLWYDYFNLIYPILGGEERIIWTIENYWRKLLDSSFVSCWTLQEKHTDYMWKKYAGIQGGVAIKVNKEKFCEHIDNQEKKIIHRDVNYERIQHTIKERILSLRELLKVREISSEICYQKENNRNIPKLIDYLNDHRFLFTKREEYSTEQEYRFVMTQTEHTDLELWVKKINQLGVEYGTCSALSNYYVAEKNDYLKVLNTPIPNAERISFPFNMLVEEIHLSPYTSFHLAKKVFSLLAENIIPFDIVYWRDKIHRYA